MSSQDVPLHLPYGEVFRERVVRHLLPFASLCLSGLTIVLYQQFGQIDRTVACLASMALASSIWTLVIARRVPDRWNRGFLASSCCLVVMLVILSKPHPDVSATQGFIPLVIFTATFLGGRWWGFICVVVTTLFQVGIELGWLTSAPAVYPHLDRDAFIARLSVGLLAIGVAFLSDLAYSRALERIEEQNREIEVKNRLSSLTDFVGGLAHEINNPLMIVRGALHLLNPQMAVRPLSKEQMHLWYGRAEFNLKRIEDIVSSLLAVTRSSDLASDAKELFDLRQLIDETCAQLEFKLKTHGIQVNIAVDPQVQILGLRFHVQAILSSILDNAADACADIPLPENRQITVSLIEAKENWQLSVADQGSGIDLKIEDRIFEPFFTTKPVGQGTGMGLALAFGLCRSLSWTLSLSHRQRPTEFQIAIPRAHVQSGK